MTIRELLYKELHGESVLKATEVREEVSLCVDKDFDFFVGTERVKPLMEGMDQNLPYVPGLNKAIGFLKVYENKILKEEKVTERTAKILLHDIMIGLNESIKALESGVLTYKKADKEKLAKIYSTLLFEAQSIGHLYDVEVNDLRIKNYDLKELIEEDFFTMSEEVL